MNKDFFSNQIDSEETDLSPGDIDYRNLINKLQEIKSTITLLGKKYSDKL